MGVTTGAWATPDVAQRVAAIKSWTCRPDFGSVNWCDPGADAVAAALLDLGVGVGVEAGICSSERLRRWRRSDFRAHCLRALVELLDLEGAEVVGR